MRTNIELDDDLLAEAGRYAATRQKRAIVQEELTLYVATRREELRRTTYRERLQTVRAEVRKARVKSDAHDLVRRDRERG
jgi:Arc/MetJ family transcription regulator